MIKLQSQTLALNAIKVPGPDYRMDQTVKMNSATTPTNVISFIQSALNNISETILENVVINCHGSPGVIYLNDNNFIDNRNVRLFNSIKNKIGTLWITGCQIASGSSFCRQLALTAGCRVVAADVLQFINPGYYLRLFPKNCIDEFEGTAYQWDSNGNKTEFSRRDWLKL